MTVSNKSSQAPVSAACRGGGLVLLAGELVDLTDETPEQARQIGLLQVRRAVVDDLGDVVEPPLRHVADHETVPGFQELVAQPPRRREAGQVPGDPAQLFHLRAAFLSSYVRTVSGYRRNSLTCGDVRSEARGSRVS
ncbi:hypothetical protein [Streptomyces sp. NPDC058254]|uniref:hypothetical protein n=1 Tax=Streptomyces sp. NPDC058254 TaxID=3346406 RepID=UPI0036EF7EEF